MTVLQTGIMVAVMAVVTFATRALPFILFPKHKTTPRFVVYLGKVLPFAITGMLLVFCLKETVVLSYPYGIPEIIGIVTVVTVYLTSKKSLPAIAAGTLVYMFLVQVGWFG